VPDLITWLRESIEPPATTSTPAPMTTADTIIVTT